MGGTINNILKEMLGFELKLEMKTKMPTFFKKVSRNEINATALASIQKCLVADEHLLGAWARRKNAKDELKYMCKF